MEVFDTPALMRRWSRARRAGGQRIAVVPTMGALHEGHLALIERAHAVADAVIVTIFVNPLQFDQRLDFDRYPRPIEGDLAACAAARVDAVYAPTAGTMYPAGFDTHFEPGRLADLLEGAMRPGHFRGVTTVVTKLLTATLPDVAVFGQKDYQQLAIVLRMVRDLDLGVEIVSLATVREPDGLARSSRNVRLTSDDREAAVVLSRALATAARIHAAGERDAVRLVAAATVVVDAERRARLEYVELVDAESLEALDVVDRPAVILTAAWFGEVRLIDNVVLGS